MLEKGTIVWASAKVGDTEGTRAILQRYGHMWRVDRPSLSDPDWVWCVSCTGHRYHDFHLSELTPTDNEEGVTIP